MRAKKSRTESGGATDPATDLSGTEQESGDMFDSLGSEIAGLLRQAHRTSDQIVREAGAEAKTINDDAETRARAQAQEILDRTEAQAADRMSEAQAEVDALCATACTDLEQAARLLDDAQLRERTVREESDALAAEAARRHGQATEARDRTLDVLRQVQAAAERLSAESAEVHRQLAEAAASLDEPAEGSRAESGPAGPVPAGDESDIGSDVLASDVGAPAADKDVIDLRQGADTGHTGGPTGSTPSTEPLDGSVDQRLATSVQNAVSHAMNQIRRPTGDT